MLPILSRAYLVVHLLVFWGYAIAWIGWPEALAAKIGLQILDADGMADLRAMYGGMCAGVGVIFAAGLRVEAWRHPAILLGVATSSGLFLARLYSAATFGMFGLPNAVFAVTEVPSAVIGAYLLSRTLPPRSPE